ncbi:LD-carboxypeptidase [Glycomyces sp. NPDC046736]|uniref:S66 peptidase family protein n=1 Tax=Glycomyces sp. NPDC046736 TaxID=3155615 RepID=UPI00340A3464
MEPLRPKRLQPGDTVAICAPSGPVLPERRHELDAAVALIEGLGFKTRLSPLVEAGGHHLWNAARPEVQAAELNALLADPQVRAIIPFEGGNGVTGFLDRIDYDAIRRDPKPLLGFSDITGLHLAMHSQTGLVGFHADLVPGLSGEFWGASAERHNEVRDLLFGLLTGAVAEVALPAEQPWETWREGRASGRLVGGLLGRLMDVQASPYALPPEAWDGAVFFWEDVARSTGHVWNQLHVLRMQGVFDRIAGMVVGIPCAFEGIEPPLGPVSVREVVLDVVGEGDFPILGGVDFGHTGPNLPMPIGALASVDAGARELRLLESPVA